MADIGAAAGGYDAAHRAKRGQRLAELLATIREMRAALPTEPEDPPPGRVQ